MKRLSSILGWLWFVAIMVSPFAIVVVNKVELTTELYLKFALFYGVLIAFFMFVVVKRKR